MAGYSYQGRRSGHMMKWHNKLNGDVRTDIAIVLCDGSNLSSVLYLSGIL